MNGNTDTQESGYGAMGPGTKNLLVLSSILKHVLIPIEKHKSENMTAQLAKFSSTLDDTAHQVTGTISIRLPQKDDAPDRTAAKNKELMIKYEAYVNEWNKIISAYLEKESKR